MKNDIQRQAKVGEPKAPPKNMVDEFAVTIIERMKVGYAAQPKNQMEIGSKEKFGSLKGMKNLYNGPVKLSLHRLPYISAFYCIEPSAVTMYLSLIHI